MLILVPGLLCDRAIWRDQIEAFGEAHEIIVPELFDFTSIAAMAGSILSGVPARFALVGHSMGARVALEIIRRAPERVERLALLDTGIHTVKEGEEASRLSLVDVAKVSGMAALAEKWLPPMVNLEAATSIKCMPMLRSMVERMTPQIFENQVRALLTRPDPYHHLATIDCPTFVGVGSEDRWSPPAQHREIAALIPGARMTVFQGSGHMSPAEAPDQVNDALGQWLLFPPKG